MDQMTARTIADAGQDWQANEITYGPSETSMPGSAIPTNAESQAD